MEKLLKERYELIQQIQRGGFGITWLAIDRVLELQVAVKEYCSEDEVSQKNFFAEARKLARYSDEPGIVNVRDYFEEEGKAWLVMEYLPGEDLNSRIKREGAFSFARTWQMMEPLLGTIGRMHEDGLIHRDISPDNIRILPDGTLKLLDFGSTLDMGQDQERTMTVEVKPGYAPYEQYMSKKLQGSWTDVYALCASIYKCITGVTPADSLQRAFRDELPLPRSLGAKISPEEEAVLMKGMALKPEGRIRTVQELVKAIDSGAEGAKNILPLNQVKEAESRNTLKEESPENGKFTEQTGEADPCVSSAQSGELRKNAVVPGRDDSCIKQKDRNTEEATRKKDSRSQSSAADRKKKSGKRKKRRALCIASAVVILTAAGILGTHLLQSDQSLSGVKDQSTCYFKNETVTASKLKKIGRNKELKTVDFSYCKLDEHALEQLASIEQVETVRFLQCTGITTLAPLASMENLDRLRFDNKAVSNPVATDADQIFSVDFPYVTDLTIEILSEKDNGAFLEHFPNLRALYFYSEGISSLEFLEEMSGLERLAITRDVNLSGNVSDPVASCTKLKFLQCNDTGLDTLAFAENLKNLEELNVENCEISDLTPLAGHENLRILNLNRNRVSDLTPLEDSKQLRNLYLNENQVVSLEPLSDTGELANLYLNNNQVSSLSALEGSSGLNHVEADGNALTSLEGLQNSAKSLYVVSAAHNQITDISALQGCSHLGILSLQNNQITSLAVCEGMVELKNLSAGNNQIRDVGALRNSTQLVNINLADNQIGDIDFLENHFTKLEVLNITNNRVTSLKPLSDSSAMKVLAASDNQITGLEGLEGKNSLYALLLNRNEIQSLAPIAENTAVLLYGDFGNNKITDVSVLSKLSGRKLWIFLENNRISDISMLPVGRRYEALTVYGNPLKDVSVIGQFEDVNFMYDRLYIGYSDSSDLPQVLESPYGKGLELRIVDCPASEQGRVLQQIKDVHGMFSGSFVTSEGADQELDEYRKSILKTLMGEEEEESGQTSGESETEVIVQQPGAEAEADREAGTDEAEEAVGE